MIARGCRNGAAVNVLVMDVSVHSTAPSIDVAIWRSLGTRQEGEAVASAF